jgi:hypothetical protein
MAERWTSFVLLVVLLPACASRAPVFPVAVPMGPWPLDAPPGKPAPHTPTGPWEGSKDRGQYTEVTPRLTNSVRIVFDPANAGWPVSCEEIVIIQTVQNWANGVPIRPEAYENKPVGQNAGDRDIDDLPGTPDVNETGSYIDAPLGIPPSSQPGSLSPNGALPNVPTPAELEDGPEIGGGDFKFKSPANPHGWDVITWLFESCAYCIRGDDTGKFFGCLKWNYTRTAEQAAKGEMGDAIFTGQRDKPSAGFRAAFDAFRGQYPTTYPAPLP